MKAILITALLLTGCAGIKVGEILPPEPVALPEKAASTPSQASRSIVTDLALASECAKTAHDVQGTPPPGFMRGIALTYARAACNPTADWVKVASQPVGTDAKKDALAHYGLATGPARLESTFALVLGSAARESSWRWCVGKDPGASNDDAETCEAGLYQTSYNSRSASPVLPALFARYRAADSGCYAAEYKGKTTCSASNLKNYGSGDGVEFQRLSKECPGFATEYHAVMVRVRRTHYGPINLKKSLIKPACVSMFSKIGEAIKANPGICSNL